MKFEWKCPRCKAPANGCGPKPSEICDGPLSDGSGCMGFICECEHETGEDHGATLEDPCKNANCYHCEWGGTFPKPPKGLQAWEKKALEAGWTMPESRKKELNP